MVLLKESKTELTKNQMRNMCSNESATSDTSSTGKSPLQYSPNTSIPSITSSDTSTRTILAPNQSSPLGGSAAPRSSPPLMPSSNGATATQSNMGPNIINPSSLHALDHYRLQLYNYAMAERLRCNQYPIPFSSPYSAMGPYGPRLALQMSLFHNRMFAPEEPKPQHSYIGLIAMAILSTPDQKLVLSDIYQHILDNYPYFRNRGPGWRNSIRHNLSLNDCFIKSGRSANGKGHFWAIHPANVDDFKKGDFRRRKAQRKVRKHMGLAVDDDGADSPSPPPLSLTPPPGLGFMHPWATHPNPMAMYSQISSRKRQFDVASLLAPDDGQDSLKHPIAKRFHAATSDLDEDIDVVASDQDDTILDRTSDNLTSGGSPSSTDDNLSSPSSTSHPWPGLMQWPNSFHPLGVGVDPRLFGRYYGQYMAAAHASRRLNHVTANNNNIGVNASNSGHTELHELSTVQSNDC